MLLEFSILFCFFAIILLGWNLKKSFFVPDSRSAQLTQFYTWTLVTFFNFSLLDWLLVPV